ncbi:hypothetical protein BHE74_00014951 [Ensete ventricosum]|nr:hypothetical protein BHE74_00014951 [Ensete ventricosum]
MVGKCDWSLSVRSAWCRDVACHSSLNGSLFSLLPLQPSVSALHIGLGLCQSGCRGISVLSWIADFAWQEDFRSRVKKNDQLKAEAKSHGGVISTKQQPEGPKPGFMVEGATLETVTPIPYDVVNDLKGGY